MSEFIKTKIDKDIGASGVITIDGSLINLLRKSVTSVGYSNKVFGISSNTLSNVSGVTLANVSNIMGV